MSSSAMIAIWALLLSWRMCFGFIPVLSLRGFPLLCDVVAKSEPEGGVVVKELHELFDSNILIDSWERNPLLIRQAFNASYLRLRGMWPLWDDIIELACISPEEDEDLDSFSQSGESARLVFHTLGKLDSFDLEVGPFDKEYLEDSFRRKDDQKYTLLVNDVDRYMPALSKWMDNVFGFLPRWRRDDAQVSLAHSGGGIGPHVDNYDVFLAQTSGTRIWKIGTRPVDVETEQKRLVPGLSVSILNMSDLEFTEWQLKEGDILYLPPRVVHWGTAQTDDCMTLSIGCRAPSAFDLIARIVDELSTSVSATATARYQQPDLIWNGTRSYPSITQQVREDTKKLVWDAIHNLLEDDNKWDEILGKAVTEPIRFMDGALRPYAEIDDDGYLDIWGKSPRAALKRIQKGRGCLLRAEGVSFATSQIRKDMNRLFAYGRFWQVEGKDPITELVFHRIERGNPIQKKHLEGAQDSLLTILEDLLAEGLLYAAKG